MTAAVEWMQSQRAGDGQVLSLCVFHFFITRLWFFVGTRLICFECGRRVMIEAYSSWFARRRAMLEDLHSKQRIARQSKD